MPRRALLVATALVAACLSGGPGAPHAHAATDCPITSTGRSIVTFDPGADAVERLRAAGATDVEVLAPGVAAGRLHGRSVRGARAVAPELLRRLSATNDPYAGLQWAPPVLHTDTALARASAADVTVAVLDSGVDGTHPDLAGAVGAGWDATVDPPAPIPAGANSDPVGHGTFVAGIVAAARGNGIGIAGLAPGVRIVPIRVADSTGSVRSSAIVRGVNLAVAAGARVLNLSFGGCGFSQAEQDAISAAARAGAAVVAAAGNYQEGREGASVVVYPAAYADVVAVGATLRGDGLAPYSVRGDFVDLTAPGGSGSGTPDADIISTESAANCSPACYTLRAGTSFAAPHVSGVLAVLLGTVPALTGPGAAQVAMLSSVDLGPPGRDPAFGEGRVDLLGALALATGSRTAARLAGGDRYETAAALSAAAYPNGSPVAYVARGDVFSPDALAAGPAAVAARAPVLLTRQCELPAATANELARLQATEVVVLGGEAAVCDAVRDAIEGLPRAPEVRRVAGADRFATAAALASDTFPAGVDGVYLARGEVFSPDALVGGTAAGVAGSPILLAAGCSLPDATLAELDALHSTRVTILGGSAAVCDAVADQLRARGLAVSRVAGADRWATAVAVGRMLATAPGGAVAVARGDEFSPDALAAAPYAAALKMPLLLAGGCYAPPPTAIDVNDRDAGSIVAAGGPAAVCDLALVRLR